jgi:hypothetical protein
MCCPGSSCARAGFEAYRRRSSWFASMATVPPRAIRRACSSPARSATRDCHPRSRSWTSASIARASAASTTSTSVRDEDDVDSSASPLTAFFAMTFRDESSWCTGKQGASRFVLASPSAPQGSATLDIVRSPAALTRQGPLVRDPSARLDQGHRLGAGSMP